MDQKRIVAVVINSVSHDARVLKEADSLARAGYEVAIYGIQDNRCSEPKSVRETGVVIHRCEWKHESHLIVSRLFLAGGFVAAAIALGLYVLLFDRIAAVVMSPPVAALMFGAAVVIILLIPFLYQYRKHRIIAARLRPERPGPVREPRRPGVIGWLPNKMIEKVKNRVFQMVRKRQIITLMREFSPHAVHCHDLSTVPIGHAYARRSGCKVVFDSHELFEEQSLATPLQKRIYRQRQRRYSGRVDAFVTINQSIADYLKKRYPRLPDPVLVKNGALPLEEPVEYDGRLHEAASLPRERRILLYQGGFALRRGLDALVRSCVLLPDSWCLVMMGWGAFEPDLRRIAGEIDPRGDSIRFIPAAPQPELAWWTAGGSLGVIPYENVCLNHWLCSPNKLWEYPIAGVPILASPFPELRTTIEQWDIGLLLPDPATPESIAQAVASVTDERLAEMKRNCLRYIEQDNWTVYEDRLVALYDRLLARTRPEQEADPIINAGKAAAAMASGSTLGDRSD
ncbi:MAG: glycosyltransferase family 4 protein [Phycisphaerales bacterium]|nr:MAG: glycosyltransferase family 4 protein [Phycisphaerales bacterium]